MTTLAPIALFCYNRPDHLRQTVESLKRNELASESDLIVFSDGPRTEVDGPKVKAVRDYIRTISGFKRIEIHESPHNKGLANSIIDGITEVVNKYGKIIVLEDDLITSPYFLMYINDGLEMYKNEDKVISIHGHNFPSSKKFPNYFFLKHTGCWGWGTWKRGWDLFEPNAGKLLSKIDELGTANVFDMDKSYSFYKMLKNQKYNRINSWAIRFEASAFVNDKLTLYPGRTLVNQIGFDGSGTHCGAGLENRINSPFPTAYCKEKVEIVEENTNARKIYSNCLLNLASQKRPKLLWEKCKKSTIIAFRILRSPIFFTLTLKHAISSCLKPVLKDSYFSRAKYSKHPRFKEIKDIKIGDYSLTTPDSTSFVNSWIEIFEHNIYYFNACNITEKPIILDIGANIGLSILFLKKCWPKARIVAYEADPEIFNYLRKNLANNGINDVDIVNKAVWTVDGEISFLSEGADAGRIDSKGNKKIECVDIHRIIDSFPYIDFLKLDIEGAETDVLLRAGDKLSRARFIFIEYHSKTCKQQTLGEILNLLTDNGFRYNIHNIHSVPNAPFVNHFNNNGFDLQLNIFAENINKN